MIKYFKKYIKDTLWLIKGVSIQIITSVLEFTGGMFFIKVV